MPKRNLIVLAAALVVVGVCWKVIPYFIPDSHSIGQQDLSEFRPLAEIYDLLDRRFVERLDAGARQRFLEAAVRGGVASLGDPHSEYLPPDRAAHFSGDLQGRFTGVGVEIDARSGRLVIVSVVKSSPAFEAGLLADDRIVQIAGQPADAMTVADAARLIRGEAGSRIELTVAREGEPDPLTFSLVRRPIDRNPVRGFRPDGQGGWDYLIGPPQAPAIGYLRVSDFVENEQVSTLSRFDAALGRLRAAGARGLIIDLRDNTGGILDQAVRMVNRFVGDGVIIAQRGAHGEKVYRAEAPGTETDWPVVVLINRRSASASEIVAGSLAVRGRAVLVGQRSLGKGTMQETIWVNNAGGGRGILKLTVAYLYLPDGRSFNRTPPPLDFAQPPELPMARRAEHVGGIKPTVTVEMTSEQELAAIRCRLKIESLTQAGSDPTRRAPPSHSDARPGQTATTQPDTAPSDWGPTTQSRLVGTAPPDTVEHWTAELLRVDRQLAAAVDVLGDPDLYRALLARAPTTAAEDF